MKPAAPVQYFNWSAQGHSFSVAHHAYGSGPDLLFLPAMSTVSTRMEWNSVASELANQFTVTLVDWPGFGASSRPRVKYTPILYEQFLRDFVRTRFVKPVSVVATGHAAGYVLRGVAAGTSLWSRAVLAAPTWRGPLPTAMGEHRKLYGLLASLVAIPLLGHALYHINTSLWFLRRMYGRHVFVNQSRLTRDFLTAKQCLARLRGGRFASTAFVTGALDPFLDRRSCYVALERAPFPILLVLGKGTPSKSAAEMRALAEITSIRKLLLPGSLGLHEEEADALIAPLREFLVGQM